MRTSPISLLFRVLVALVAVVVVAVGCGSDGDPTETSSDDTSQSDDSSGGDDAADDPDMEDDSAAAAIYCEARAASNAATDNINPSDPESVRGWVYGTRDAIRDVLPQSPQRIRDDIAVLLAGFEEFIVILEAHDFDFFAALPEIEALQESPEQAAANARLDAFEEENCPTESIDGGDASSGSNSFEDALATPEIFLGMLESEGGRELIISGMIEDGDFTRDQAECLIDHPDFIEFFALIGGEAPSPDLIPTIMGVFSECGIALDSLGG